MSVSLAGYRKGQTPQDKQQPSAVVKQRRGIPPYKPLFHHKLYAVLINRAQRLTGSMLLWYEQCCTKSGVCVCVKYTNRKRARFVTHLT